MLFWFRAVGRPTSGESVFLNFDAATGALSVDSPDTPLAVLELKSDSEYFTGAKATTLDGLFDVFKAGKIFRMNPNGFETLDLENPVTPGTTAASLAMDICYRGAAVRGGPLGKMYVRSGDAVHAIKCGGAD